MKLGSVVDKFSGMKHGLKDFFENEHTISVDNALLDKFRGKISDKLASKGMSDSRFGFLDDYIFCEGKFEQQGGGSLSFNLRPSGFIWAGDEHYLLFKVGELNVALNSSVKNIIFSFSSKLCDLIFGEMFFARQSGVLSDDNVLSVHLDEKLPYVAAICKSIELKKLECQDSKMLVTFTPRPKNILAGGKELFDWWKNKV